MTGCKWVCYNLPKVLVVVCCLVVLVSCDAGASDNGPNDAAVDGRDSASMGDVRDKDGASTDTSSLDVRRPDVRDAFSNFQLDDSCQEEGREKRTLFVKGETYAPQQFDGCVRVSIVKNGEATASQITTPETWAYTGAEVAAERCYDFEDASTAAATSAFGTIEMEYNFREELTMIEYDILLEFPRVESNPYSEYVRIQGMDNRPADVCVK